MPTAKTKSKGIVSWPAKERPREKLILKGPESLTANEDLHDHIKRHPLLEWKAINMLEYKRDW